MNVHASRTLTDALLAELVQGGLLVGDAQEPAGAGWQSVQGQSAFVPYCVLYGLTGGYADGTIANPYDDASVTYQVTSVGANRSQCEWVADRARNILVATTVNLGTRVLALAEPDMLPGVTRDDDVQPPVFSAFERFRFYTTPVTV